MGPGLPSKPFRKPLAAGAQDWSPTPLSEGPDIFRCTRERGHVHPLRQMYDTKRTVTGELTLVAG